MDQVKNLEDIYQKKTQKEHILLRPDTYIGSVEIEQQEMWIFDDSGKIVKKQIQLVQGLFKIFDEIIVNAADNHHRDNKTNKIEISIDKSNGEITVKNNGPGIPIEIHKKEKMYIPEMIFGELLTGSNFDDGQKKVTGGRNGYGAKLTNIYSTSFCLESADSQRKKMIKIRWKDNMSIKENPIIKEYNKGSDYVEIKFIPDYKRFKLNNITEDIYQLFKKRVYDLAGVMGKKVKIFFN